MNTVVIKVTEENIDEAADKAAELLSSGGLVAIPTETVYGLAASAYDDEAVKNIFEVKGRPQDNPVIVHISDLAMLKEVCAEITDDAQKLADRFWPGPLTLILKKSESVCNTVTCGMDTVGIRMPSQRTAHAIIERSGIPLAIPSANLSGKPSTTTARHCVDDLNGKIPMIVDDGACEIGVESTVISLVSDVPTILRPGIISLEEIQEVLPNAVVSPNVFKSLDKDAKVESPGLKYKHYSPRADVVIVKGTLEKFANYVAEHQGNDVYAMCFDGENEKITIPSYSYGVKNDAESQARNIFSVLRQLDGIDAATVYVRAPEETSKALAVSNRLTRAAGFKVVEL